MNGTSDRMTSPTADGQGTGDRPRPWHSARTYEEQAELECWRTICQVQSPLLERATIKELAPIVLAFKQLIIDRQSPTSGEGA